MGIVSPRENSKSLSVPTSSQQFHISYNGLSVEAFKLPSPIQIVIDRNKEYEIKKAEEARRIEEARKAEEERQRQIALNVPIKIPQQDVANELVALGLPVEKFICIIGRESQFIQNAININNGIIGLTQITFDTWNGAGCIGNPKDWKDALVCTAKIYKLRGDQPWRPLKFENGQWVDDPNILHC
jgi:hypothetical protein